MARVGISLDLGADLAKAKARKEKPPEEKKVKPTFDKDQKPAGYVFPVFIILLLIMGLVNLTSLGALDTVDNQIKESYENILKNDLRKQIQADYPRASDGEKQKILTRQFLEKRNDVDYLKTVYSRSKELQDNYRDDSGRVYFFGLESYRFLNAFEDRYGDLGFDSQTIVFYLPLLAAILAGLFMFFTVWKLADIYAAFLAAAVFLTNPVLIKTNAAGLIVLSTFWVPLIAICMCVFALFKKKWAFIGVVPLLGILFLQWPGQVVWNNPFNDIGYILSFIALNSFLVLTYKFLKKQEKPYLFGYFALVFGVTLFAASFEKSLVPFLVPAAAMIVGMGYYVMRERILDFGNSIILPARNEYWHFAFLGSILLILFLSMIPTYTAAQSKIPLMNDATYDAAQFIQAQTPEDSKILLWYLNGPSVEYYADREVLLSHANQEREKTLVATGLLGSEEDAVESFGELCSGNCYVFVTEEMLYHIRSLAQSANKEYYGKRIKVSQCRQVPDAIVCGNGYVVTSEGPFKRGVHPAVSILMLNGTKTEKTYAANGPGFVMYSVGNSIMSFEIDRELIDSLLVKFFIQDSLKNFKLVGMVEEPRQVMIYEIGVSEDVEVVVDEEVVEETDEVDEAVVEETVAEESFDLGSSLNDSLLN